MFKELEPSSKTGRLIYLMKNYGVSFDLDGVKVATSSGSVKIYNSKFGFKYNLLKSTEDLDNYFAMTGWLTQIKKSHPEALSDPMQEAISIWNDDENFRNSPVESGVIPLMQLMYNHGVNPYDLTSRPVVTKDATEHWIRTKMERFGDLTNRLNMQTGSDINPEFKADRAEELNVLFHFEDSGDHAERIADRGIIVGLVIQPWSKNYFPKNPLIIRPSKYEGRSQIIRTFLTLSDFVAENQTLVDKIITSHNIDSLRPSV